MTNSTAVAPIPYVNEADLRGQNFELQRLLQQQEYDHQRKLDDFLNELNQARAEITRLEAQLQQKKESE